MALIAAKLLSVFGYFVPINAYILNYFKTNNSTKEILHAEIIKKLFAVVLIFTFSSFYGLDGLIIGIGVNSIIEFGINTVFLANSSKLKKSLLLLKNTRLFVVNYLFILGFLVLEILINESFSFYKIMLLLILIIYTFYNLYGKINIKT
jgi:hypothetical protein